MGRALHDDTGVWIGGGFSGEPFRDDCPWYSAEQMLSGECGFSVKSIPSYSRPQATNLALSLMQVA